jgi:hypothetical protein
VEQLVVGGIDIVVLELPTLAVHGGTAVDHANWSALGPPSRERRFLLPYSHFPKVAKQIYCMSFVLRIGSGSASARDSGLCTQQCRARLPAYAAKCARRLVAISWQKACGRNIA